MAHDKRFLAFMEDLNDQSAVPDPTIREMERAIVSAIRKDPDRIWSNALELVHYGYSETGTERPSPFMRAAWGQYEAIIQFTVKALGKYCKNTDWRATSIPEIGSGSVPGMSRSR